MKNKISNMNTMKNKKNMKHNTCNIKSERGNSEVKDEPPKEIIPRMDKSLIVDYYIKINKNDKINIIMAATSGFTIVLPTQVNISVKQLIRNYINKLGLGEGVLKDKIVFLFNANLIDINDNKQVNKVFKHNSRITVIDVYGVIAA